jgi:hypothetical protein
MWLSHMQCMTVSALCLVLRQGQHAAMDAVSWLPDVVEGGTG